MTKYFKTKHGCRETYYQTIDGKVNLHFFIEFDKKNKRLLKHGELNSTSLTEVDFGDEHLISIQDFETALKKLFNQAIRNIPSADLIVLNKQEIDRHLEIVYEYDDSPMIKVRY